MNNDGFTICELSYLMTYATMTAFCSCLCFIIPQICAPFDILKQKVTANLHYLFTVNLLLVSSSY